MVRAGGAALTASGWYIVTAAAVIALWFPTARKPADQMLYLMLVALGLIPCMLVLIRAISGRYGDENGSGSGSGAGERE